MHVYTSGQTGAHGCEWKETREAHQRMLLFFLPLPSPDSRGIARGGETHAAVGAPSRLRFTEAE
jgi:hypothetical protein